jgi:hypothetical protein
MRRHSLTMSVPAVIALLALGGSAYAATTGPSGSQRGAAIGSPAPARNLPGLTATSPLPPRARIAPASSLASSLYDSDSCAAATFGPTFECMATGYYVSYGVHVLGDCWEQGMAMWNGCYPSDAEVKNLVNLATGVSCSSPDQATCLVVGEHYDNPRYETQLAESEQDGGNVTIQDESNPRGSTWSVLQDASCPTPGFCLTVGAAGTSRKTRHGVVFHAHATAYEWNGTAFTALSVPAPAPSGYAELSAVSCFAATTCLAVGNYINGSGRWKTYSALWTNGSWQVAPALNVTGEKYTTFQSVSCPTATNCIAVGDSYPKATSTLTRGFAEAWNSGTWTFSAEPGLRHAALMGVACPAAGSCVAVGWHETRALTGTLDGTSWTWQETADTKRPFPTDVLDHVSCAAAGQCVAVGYRYDASVRPSRRSFRTLAELWNGISWSIMKTYI